jgi:hypothetical protein
MNRQPSYQARAVVGIVLYALIGLAIPIALLAISCAFIALWLALGLPA